MVEILGEERYNHYLDMLNSIKVSVESANRIVDDAARTSDELSATLSSLTDVLNDLDTQLTSMQETFGLISGDFSGARDRLSLITSSSSVEDIRKIIGEDPNKFATLITTPVLMERNVVFPMPNNAASMSGFYIAICIWVGALLLAALMMAELSKKRKEDYKSLKLKN